MNIRVITNAAAVLLVAGCSKDPRPSRYKAATTEVTTVAGDFVTPRQVKSVAQKMFPQTRVSAGVGIEVEAVTDAAGDTLMYIVNNPGGGWKVLSADARTPAVLAEGAEGSFSIENACDGLKVWMDCLASDMEAVRSAATDELNFTSEEISANRSFWGGGRPTCRTVADAIAESGWGVENTDDYSCSCCGFCGEYDTSLVAKQCLFCILSIKEQ